MQILFLIVGVITLIFNDYSTDWSKIFPSIMGVILILTSLYSILMKKVTKTNVNCKDLSIHIGVLVLVSAILSYFNVFLATIFYVICYKLVDKSITIKQQIIILSILLSSQYIFKTFLYFNI